MIVQYFDVYHRINKRTCWLQAMISQNTVITTIITYYQAMGKATQTPIINQNYIAIFIHYKFNTSSTTLVRLQNGFHASKIWSCALLPNVTLRVWLDMEFLVRLEQTKVLRVSLQYWRQKVMIESKWYHYFKQKGNFGKTSILGNDVPQRK